MAIRRRVLSIPQGVAFLPALVEALVSGRLVPGFPEGDDPAALASATIYVPTRRAARALRAAFAERAPMRAAILPSIRPLGEFDEDEGWFGGEGAIDLLPAIAPLERQFHLAGLVRRWKERLPAHVESLYGERVVVPATAADALYLAADVGRLIDDVDAAEADWTALARAGDDSLSAWWQVTRTFLGIVTEQWPAALAELARANPAARRNAAIDAEAARLRARPPAGPVIAAGSTGSLPATARLLATIAGLESGAVVLPGHDPDMDAATLAALSDPHADASVPGHPQFGLVRLLRHLGVDPREVVPLGAAAPGVAARSRLLSAALRPPAATADWPAARAAIGDEAIAAALADVAILEAADEREEGMAIAVALREAIETSGAVAALVTPDRALARRVASELLRFGIRADDSGGTPLGLTPHGSLLAWVLSAVFHPGDPVAIVSLLRHPLVRLGRAPEAVRGAGEHLELVALRGGTGRPDVAALDRLVAARRVPQRHAPAWRARLDDDALAGAEALAGDLVMALAPLIDLRGRAGIHPAEAAAAVAAVLERLAGDEAGRFDPLYADESGEALAALLSALAVSTASFAFAAEEFPDVMAAMTSGLSVKPRASASSRVFVWGALEARLQHADLVVLGGLDEGVWPAQPEPGQFLSRVMRAELALDPPERRIGLAAHDFTLAAGAPRLLLARSATSAGAPAVASRWIERLRAFAGEDALREPVAKGRRLIALAAAHDRAPRRDFAPRPEPRPPLAARPRRFTFTEIETLRRDPYAIYARRILRLDPLDPLVADPAAAERGSLFHDILARFIRDGGDPLAADAETRLDSAGRAAFADADLPGDVAAVWWPRYEAMAAGYLAWERGRDGVTLRLAEIRADDQPVETTGVTIGGRADRIDLRADGRAEIIDFKTGSQPSASQAHTLIAPQLPLEAALLRRGAFGPGPGREPADLVYLRLKADGEARPESILVRGRPKSEKTADGIAEEAWSRLVELLEWFGTESNPYRSRVLPMREGDFGGDYDHLARVLEWSAGNGPGDDDGAGEP